MSDHLDKLLDKCEVKPAEFKARYKVRRYVGSSMDGCLGKTLYSNGADLSSSIDLEAIVGEDFETGTVLEVVVRVVKTVPLRPGCRNTTNSHRHHCSLELEEDTAVAIAADLLQRDAG